MLEQLLANNAKSTLSVAISSNSQASLTLQTGHGARFPAVQAGDFFNVTLDDGTNVEICRCVGIAGDVLTVLRGMEGTTAQSAFAITVTRVELRLTADSVLNLVFRRQMDTKWIRPASGVNSWQVGGLTLPTVVNSQVAGALTNSSTREQNERIRLVSANSATASDGSSWRIAQKIVSGQKGYRASVRFGVAFVPNSSHLFIGLINTTGVLAQPFPPSSLQNGIAIGWDNAGSLQGTFLNLYVANSAGPATKLALSSYFNVNTTAWYEAEFYQMEGRARIDYTVRRLDVSTIPDVTSYFTANIPDNSLWLSPFVHGTTMVTSALAVELGPWQFVN